MGITRKNRAQARNFSRDKGILVALFPHINYFLLPDTNTQTRSKVVARNLLFFCAVTFFINAEAAEKIVWSGEVSSNGEPTETITLVNNNRYQIKVQGFVNLGKWIQNREELANDACYEFSPSGKAEKAKALANSADISVCEDKYRTDHNYQSEPFIAKQNRIHFWINDSNYDDNSGAMKVQIIELDKTSLE